MSAQHPVPVPRHMVARKPAYGSPCNRCGLCCYAVICPLGQELFGCKAGPCPALVMDDGKASCGLTLMGPDEYREAAALLLGIGNGCDMHLTAEGPADPEITARFDRWADSHREAANKARRLLAS